MTGTFLTCKKNMTRDFLFANKKRTSTGNVSETFCVHVCHFFSFNSILD